jgi:hypothetical protein
MGILGAGGSGRRHGCWLLRETAGVLVFAAVTDGVSAALRAFGLHLWWMWRWCQQVMA